MCPVPQPSCCTWVASSPSPTEGVIAVFLSNIRNGRLSLEGLGELLAVISRDVGVVKRVRAHGDGTGTASLGRVAGEDSGEVHASRGNVGDVDG